MAKLSRSNLTQGALKALGIFGGVQMINIICSILRTKLIAIWIGAAGVGLFGLYNSAIELLSVIFNLGMRNSAVRDIASATETETSRTVVVVRRWAWILGLIGLLVTVLISPLLSEFTFGDGNHTVAFMIIAIIILLSSVQNGELAVLQGTQQLRRLARASVSGVVVGVVISIPMFYYWGIDSVLPALVVFSLATTIAVLLQRVSVAKPSPSVTIKETVERGRGFMILGIYLTVSAIVTNLASYLFMSYLNHVGDTEVVGHYQAGFTLVNKYVGLIFTAIAMEYYPRLSQVGVSKCRTSTFVSHEMSIALWILFPVIAIFVALGEIIVTTLYSSEFLVVVPFIVWAIVGTIFRAISWCIAFVILARGDGKIYLLTETLSAISCILLNIGAYKYWGLEGLGMAYLVWYVIYTIVVWVVYRYRYGLSLGNGIIRLILLVVVSATVSTLGYIYMGWWIPAIIALIALPYTYKHLIRRKSRIKQPVGSCH